MSLLTVGRGWLHAGSNAAAVQRLMMLLQHCSYQWTSQYISSKKCY